MESKRNFVVGSPLEKKSDLSLVAQQRLEKKREQKRKQASSSSSAAAEDAPEKEPKPVTHAQLREEVYGFDHKELLEHQKTIEDTCNKTVEIIKKLNKEEAEIQNHVRLNMSIYDKQKKEMRETQLRLVSCKWRDFLRDNVAPHTLDTVEKLAKMRWSEQNIERKKKFIVIFTRMKTVLYRIDQDGNAYSSAGKKVLFNVFLIPPTHWFVDWTNPRGLQMFSQSDAVWN